MSIKMQIQKGLIVLSFSLNSHHEIGFRIFAKSWSED